MSRKIEDLTPVTQAKYREFDEAMKAAGIDYIVTCTLRTQAEQDALYAQGRTAPGKIVTWTRKSRHISGTAFDIAIKKEGIISWDADDYKAAGLVGESVGLTWGGSWDKPDNPHFQTI
jgi:peptidoglycan LD-endopeptidase CwlK